MIRGRGYTPVPEGLERVQAWLVCLAMLSMFLLLPVRAVLVELAALAARARRHRHSPSRAIIDVRPDLRFAEGYAEEAARQRAQELADDIMSTQPTQDRLHLGGRSWGRGYGFDLTGGGYFHRTPVEVRWDHHFSQVPPSRKWYSQVTNPYRTDPTWWRNDPTTRRTQEGRWGL